VVDENDDEVPVSTDKKRNTRAALTHVLASVWNVPPKEAPSVTYSRNKTLVIGRPNPESKKVTSNLMRASKCVSRPLPLTGIPPPPSTTN